MIIRSTWASILLFPCVNDRSSEVAHAGRQCWEKPFASPLYVWYTAWLMRNAAVLAVSPLSPGFTVKELICRTVSIPKLLLNGAKFPFMIVYPSLSYRPISAKQFCLLEKPFLTQCLFSFSVLKRTKQRASNRFHGKMSSSGEWCCGWHEQFAKHFTAFVLSSLATRMRHNEED